MGRLVAGFDGADSGVEAVLPNFDLDSSASHRLKRLRSAGAKGGGEMTPRGLKPAFIVEAYPARKRAFPRLRRAEGSGCEELTQALSADPFSTAHWDE